MSRVGKLPIKIPAGVNAKLDGAHLSVKGPKGELSLDFHPAVSASLNGDEIVLSIKDIADKKEKALWGLFRSLAANMVTGVSRGFEKKLEFIGVGYRVALSGRNLTLSVGFSHKVEFPLPAGIEAQVEGNFVTLRGADNGVLGETAARLRKIRPPEPYKGKGIKYSDEVIIRKEGKTAGKGDK